MRSELAVELSVKRELSRRASQQLALSIVATCSDGYACVHA
jgi:hypothetical protein